MTEIERIENVVRSAIEQVNASRHAHGPLDPLSIVDLMEPRSSVPVRPEWQLCISLKDGRVVIEAESQEDGDGNR